MTPQNITVLNGIGREKNPYDPYDPKHEPGTDYSRFDWFGKHNKEYPAPEMPDGDHLACLVWQYKFMDLDWLDCHGFYSKKECDICGIPTRQVWKPYDLKPIENMRDLQVILTDVTAFSNETFGTGRPYTAPLHHLKKEVEEVIDSGEVVEYADCLLLLLDSFRMKHPELDAQDLIESAYQKLKECRQRKWGKPDANGVIEHLRD